MSNINCLVASSNIYLNKFNYLYFGFLPIDFALPHLHYSEILFQGVGRYHL